jgi:hypothetical protein
MWQFRRVRARVDFSGVMQADGENTNPVARPSTMVHSAHDLTRTVSSTSVVWRLLARHLTATLSSGTLVPSFRRG